MALLPTLTHYYLHLRLDGAFIEDPDGASFLDLAAAKAEAIDAARCLMAEDIRQGNPIRMSDAIEVAGSDGKTVCTVPFSEVVSLRA